MTACCNEKEAMWILMSEDFDLAVIESQVDLGQVGTHHFGDLVRTSGYELPIIITGLFGRKKKFLKSLPKRSSMIFLAEPVDQEQLVGVAQKLLKVGYTSQPVEKRYSTDVEVVVEKYGSSQRLESVLTNLSLSGACLEFTDKTAEYLNRGDFLRVNFHKKSENKIQRVSGQVVWVEPSIEGSPGRLGLEFLKS